MAKHIHTWHGELYCGSIPLKVAQEIDGMNGDSILKGIDPDGLLLRNKRLQYVDFEGVTVIMKLTRGNYEPTSK